MFNNVLQCLVSHATIGIATLATTNHLRDRDNAAGIGYNATGIGDNPAEIGDDAAGIVMQSKKNMFFFNKKLFF